MKFIWFEDMKKDNPKALKELDEFLNVGLSDAKLEELCQHVAFDNMKKISEMRAKGPNEKKEEEPKEKKEEGHKFFRKGKVGDWKNYFQGEQKEKWNQWVEENRTKIGIDMTFE